ncbi:MULTISPECIES: LuxR family transcriptional regulator [unclassified Microbacterium]|uniref:ATP-binding protein n=1 Tax=unclassified Microbacterium TaxID=2609290 RepID=UPI00214BC7F5|nr:MULTISPECIES: LuxR family transcriptional regulator [unclassified Microbacterium]MCR2809053.1 AAA family ATPase [Microbacterium sp. zg.B185]WIM20209.1 AAA family ATPase [Microbacterium sp. zg-B185]
MVSQLLGRERERHIVEQLLVAVQAGRSRALVVRGAAGIGKTALLEHLRDAAIASRFRVETSTGVEAEMQFAFAGLHQYCAPFLDRLAALPEPQQRALGTALGSRNGPAPDKFLIGLATLNLVAEAAEHGPLLCVVDDVQWLDEASAEIIAFVARRIDAERLAIVFGLRNADGGGQPGAFSHLPELQLTGLDHTAARTLLSTAFRAPVDEAVRELIIAEARGNPLALLELPAHVPAARLAGGFDLPHLPDVQERVERGFLSRYRELPAATQLLLLAAAADPTGDPELLHRVAAELGVSAESSAPAEMAGLIDLGTKVRFRHPLVRSVVYRSADAPNRRRVHGALAAVIDAAHDPDRRAWHRAHAVSGADEAVAAELERLAGRARSRGGYAAAGAFLRRSAELTPGVADQTRRALDAAHALHTAGESETAVELLAIAERGAPDPLQRARAALLRAQIAFHRTRGTDVPQMLLDAAATLAPFDPLLSRETTLHALDAAIVGGSPDIVDIARTALAAVRAERPRPVDLLLDGLAVTVVHGYTAGVPAVRVALDAITAATRPEAVREEGSEPWLWVAGRVAVGILDDERAHEIADRNVRAARTTGALAALPRALNLHANILTISGELTRAGELVAEAESLTESMGVAPLRHARAMLAAWRGDRPTVERSNSLALTADGNLVGSAQSAFAHYASAILHNGLGAYSTALDAATATCESAELSLSTLGLPEVIEASVRTGDTDTALRALERLSARVRASDTPWARGLEARSRALTSSGPAAEEGYREAIRQLSTSKIAVETARAHLLYGEWLRREGRRHDARQALRSAYESLSEMGAAAFAQRAARELHATGERARQRSAAQSDGLTAQELQIARLVAAGATSREVGTQLFLSPRTIEAHLRNIFRKLGITSRRQLRDLRLDARG